jgi:hypothetical protein
VALLVVAISVFAATTAGAARKSPFKPGVYIGKTSQGYPVKLRLRVGQEPCSALECPAIDQSTDEYLDLAGDLVTKSGTVNASQAGFARVTAKLQVGHDRRLYEVRWGSGLLARVADHPGDQLLRGPHRVEGVGGAAHQQRPLVLAEDPGRQAI